MCSCKNSPGETRSDHLKDRAVSAVHMLTLLKELQAENLLVRSMQFQQGMTKITA